MCGRKEIILLDAKVLDVIGNAAFRAELANGHCLVAFLKGADRVGADRIAPGDTVKVQLSPFDMSKGCIRLDLK
ncbi:MAG: translation initiation factor IF-1 [Kiritimatiellae bacterium]|nr:translation initiation factor IF-1 [Kiritimatiellia bacterium]